MHTSFSLGTRTRIPFPGGNPPPHMPIHLGSEERYRHLTREPEQGEGPPIGIPAPFGLVIDKAGLCTRIMVLSEETQLIYGRVAGNADLRWPRVA